MKKAVSLSAADLTWLLARRVALRSESTLSCLYPAKGGMNGKGKGLSLKGLSLWTETACAI